MSVEQKLTLLGESAQYDLCGACGPGESRKRLDAERWIYPAALPDGRKTSLLKILMTNSCRNDCAYCSTRCSRDFRRSEFEPSELALIFDQMRRAKLVSGLFLSSGVKGSPDRTMSRMLAAVEILRRKYHFHGYVHLKTLPGASRELVEGAAQLANRVSINLETPDQQHLAKIAPDKDFNRDLFSRLKWISEIVNQPGVRAKSHTTQFVVGASGESDREIVQRAADLYKSYRLHRAYYSAFQRPDDGEFSGTPGVPLMREHRLYQADWLLRKYGFNRDEIPFEADGNLSLNEDPKQLWARLHPETFPVDVTRAGRETLLRVPGIGPISARRICAERRRRPINGLSDLRALGVAAGRAAPYIQIKGRKVKYEKQELLAW